MADRDIPDWLKDIAKDFANTQLRQAFDGASPEEVEKNRKAKDAYVLLLDVDTRIAAMVAIMMAARAGEHENIINWLYKQGLIASNTLDRLHPDEDAVLSDPIIH